MAALVDSAIGGDPGMLENLFQQIIADLKASFPIWEDFTSKASKLHTVLRSAVYAISAFLESMQKVADMALGTRGATSDLGSALTRLCLRQRGLEDKLKAFVGSIVECLVNPLQSRMDEWKKMVNLLDKDHAKESKRVHQEMKKAFAETVVLKKKAKKGKPGAGAQVEQAVADYKEKYETLEALERNSVRTALIEERGRFCHFVNCLNPVMDCQVAMLSEITHISEIISYLKVQSVQPCFMPNQNYVVQEWRKATTPDYILQSSPGSPSVSQGSSKSSGSSDGCCNSPPTSTSPQLTHHLSCTTNVRLQSEDGSGGKREEESHRIQYVRCPSSWPSSPVEQPTSQTFPGAAKSSLSKSSPQRSAEHCAKCCQHCQVVVLQGALEAAHSGNHNYAVPMVSSSREPPVTTLTCDETNPKISPDEKNASEMTPDGVPPVTGYVNMNQLASLAVQQNELSQKAEPVSDKNESTSQRNGNEIDKSDNKKTTNQKQNKSEVAVAEVNNMAAHEYSEINRGRSRTAEDILSNGAACSPQISGANVLPGAKVRDLSLPPTFRKPIRTSSSLVQFSSPQMYSSVNRGRSDRQGRAPPERKQVRGAVARIPSTESPPPPPLPEDYQTTSELVLESDYLPLPPPPVYQGSNVDGAQCWPPPQQPKYPAIPEGGLLFSHPPCPPVEGDYTSLPEAYRMELGMASAVARCDGAPGGQDTEADGTANTFADSIRRGVQLRRTLTNDRSGPRLRTNP